MSPIAIIIAITAFSGVLGGYAAFLIDNRSLEISDDGTSFRTLWPYLILGVIASASVPLFLSLVKSNLLQLSLNSSSPDSFELFLIYFGLCVISAIYARKFISSISEQVLAIERKAESAKVEAKEALDTVAEIRDVVDEQDSEVKDLSNGAPPAALESVTPPFGIKLSPFAQSIMENLTHYTYRTPGGIAKDVGSERNMVGLQLNKLADAGFVNRTISPKTNGPRFTINEVGISYLNNKDGV